MSPALNGSSALQHFERSNAIEIRNGIMFNFYPGLPYMPALNGSFTLQHFERSNAIEISNGIMFNFYPGLPYMLCYIATHSSDETLVMHKISLSAVYT